MADTKPWFVKNSEEIGGAFYDFYQKCGEKGVLDKKTKELLMVALAGVFRCPHCMEEHLEKALEAGASKEEVTEASFAGQQETFLNITGREEMLDDCKKCFASLFADRAISYRNGPLGAVQSRHLRPGAERSSGICSLPGPAGD